LTSVGKSSSHPNVATTSFEDLSAGCSSSSSKLLPVLPPSPVWGTIYDREGTMGRDHIIGPLGVIHIAILLSLHESILSMVRLQPGGF